jgi:hypothetical protein
MQFYGWNKRLLRTVSLRSGDRPGVEFVALIVEELWLLSRD